MMKSIAKAALTCAILAIPAAASASDCTGVPNQTHYVNVYENGYFPTNLYACGGDSVVFTNRSGRYIQFNIYDNNNQQVKYFNWYANGYSKYFDIPATGAGYTMKYLNLAGIYNNDQEGHIILGAAPTHY